MSGPRRGQNIFSFVCWTHHENMNAFLNTLARDPDALVLRQCLRSSLMYIGLKDRRKPYTKRYLADMQSPRDWGLAKDHHITVYGAANWE